MAVRKIATVGFVLAVMSLLAGPVSAHRVNVFAWVEGDTVFVESKFPGSRMVKKGKVLVVDPEGNELLSGITNEQGEFSFKVPKHTDLKIILSAGEGHQAEWTIPATEFIAASSETVRESDAATSESADYSQIRPAVSASADTGLTMPAVDLRELEALIESTLDKKLKPITKILVEAQNRGPSAKDIIGGIGYILGLVGIAAYVQSRKKKE